jgi:hypothetical protein
MTAFEHLSKRELVAAMRAGQLSRAQVGSILVARAERHVRTVETRAKRRELKAANAKTREQSS